MRNHAVMGAVCALFVIPVALLLTGSRPQPQAPKVREHAVARYEAVVELFAHLEAQRKAGRAAGMSVADEVTWSLRLVEAAVAAGKSTPEAAHRKHLERVQARLQVLESLYEAGRVDFPQLTRVRYFVADAQVRLADAQKR